MFNSGIDNVFHCVALPCKVALLLEQWSSFLEFISDDVSG